MPKNKTKDIKDIKNIGDIENKKTQKRSSLILNYCLSITCIVLVLGSLGYNFYITEELRQIKILQQASIENINNIHPQIDKISKEIKNIIKPDSDLELNKRQIALKHADSLLSIANLYIDYLHDNTMAAKLLYQAQNKINLLEDSEFNILSTELTKNRQELLANSQIDLAKIWVGLDELNELALTASMLQKNLNNLDNLDNFENKNYSSDFVVALDENKTWKKALNNTWHELKDIIKIRKHEQPVTLDSAGLENSLRREQLRLIIEQARWSSLRKENILYQRSLNIAKDLFMNYFKLDTDDGKAFMQQLSQLAEVDLFPQRPDLLKTQAFIRKYID